MFSRADFLEMEMDFLKLSDPRNKPELPLCICKGLLPPLLGPPLLDPPSGALLSLDARLVLLGSTCLTATLVPLKRAAWTSPNVPCPSMVGGSSKMRSENLMTNVVFEYLLRTYSRRRRTTNVGTMIAKTKSVIRTHLPLTSTYTLLSHTHVPSESGILPSSQSGACTSKKKGLLGMGVLSTRISKRCKALVDDTTSISQTFDTLLLLVTLDTLPPSATLLSSAARSTATPVDWTGP
mmetsp:Transcript_21241/g.52273  ORF Transcript_21241/g.52273 Transcript_21241/m.52273 type:complete len:237 (+) Transcript_21241:2195-2905(+)